MDPRVRAIREHSRVGTGSCTSIDECYTDSELAADLDEWDITTPEAAVEWALESEGLFREMGADATSGEVDCPLVASHNRWLASN
tara:strand:- start:201 stop:455 length:255 start_codon:yes stop_codon:yes gene_type:complete